MFSHMHVCVFANTMLKTQATKKVQLFKYLVFTGSWCHLTWFGSPWNGSMTVIFILSPPPHQKSHLLGLVSSDEVMFSLQQHTHSSPGGSLTFGLKSFSV